MRMYFFETIPKLRVLAWHYYQFLPRSIQVSPLCYGHNSQNVSSS